MKNKLSILFLLLLIYGCTDQAQKINTTSKKEQTQELGELALKIAKMEKVKNGAFTPAGNIYSTDSTMVSIHEFRGKLLAIDFWATWCSPCLKESPIFNRLGGKYKGEKVEFITVSINEEFSYWKTYIEENDWEGNNYWLGVKEDEPLFSFMYSEMDIDSSKTVLIALPKYVFVSPEGKILNNSSPKPSSLEFENELQKYLAKYGD